jgi:hypothetical protein
MLARALQDPQDQSRELVRHKHRIMGAAVTHPWLRLVRMVSPECAEFAHASHADEREVHDLRQGRLVNHATDQA